MGIDERAEPPEEKKTKEMPAVPSWAIELTRSVKEGIAEVRADVALVSNDLGIVKDRVTILESERARFSNGVRALSGTDLTHEAQLAAEKVAREDLAKEVADLKATNATQLAILSRLDNIAKNPLVKTLGAMLLTALVTWLATHGVQVPR
jgi:chromosome segregation ATPase